MRSVRRPPRGGPRAPLWGTSFYGVLPRFLARDDPPVTPLSTSCSRELNGRDAEQRTRAEGTRRRKTERNGTRLTTRPAAAASLLLLGVHRRRHWNADRQVLNRGGDSVEGCRRDDGDALVVGKSANRDGIVIRIRSPWLHRLHRLHSERNEYIISEKKKERRRSSLRTYEVARGTVFAILSTPPDLKTR